MITELGANTFDAAIASAEQPVLVDFWAPWCGPCRVQLPTLERIAADEGSTSRIFKVNVDDHQQLAARYGITSIPTLLVFRKGELVKRLTGLQQESAIRAALESAGSHASGAAHVPNELQKDSA